MIIVRHAHSMDVTLKGHPQKIFKIVRRKIVLVQLLIDLLALASHCVPPQQVSGSAVYMRSSPLSGNCFWHFSISLQPQCGFCVLINSPPSYRDWRRIPPISTNSDPSTSATAPLPPPFHLRPPPPAAAPPPLAPPGLAQRPPLRWLLPALATATRQVELFRVPGFDSRRRCYGFWRDTI